MNTEEAKGSRKNSSPFSHPIFRPPCADLPLQNPQRGLCDACGFAPSDQLNLTRIWARILRSYSFASPKVDCGRAKAAMSRQWFIIVFSVLHVICILLIDDIATARQASKTLTRFHDPVIVNTSLLRELPTRETARYRLYSAHQGVLSPIPFQFDERDDTGEIVFPGKDDTGDFTFDDDDELVFMAKDLGDRIPPSLLPGKRNGAFEIEVTDPVNESQGWAYLLHFSESPPPLSPVTYATFDSEANQARALFYTMDYFPGWNFFTAMRIHAIAGGTGENILNRMKLRIQPTFSLGLTTWSPLFTEQDMTVKIDGVKNGHVRAIRRVRQSLDLGRYLPSIPNGTTYTYFYFSSFITPSKFKIPWLVLKLLREFRFTGVSDFRQNAIGMKYWDAPNSQGLIFTGSHETNVNTKEDHDWYVVSGKAGTHLQAFIIPEEWKQWGIVRGTVFLDDDLALQGDGPEDEPGTHAAGYSLLNMANIREPGEYDMTMAVIVLSHPYSPGDEKEPLAMLKQPLVPNVQRIP